MPVECSKSSFSDGNTSLNPLQVPQLSNDEGLFQKQPPAKTEVKESFARQQWLCLCLLLYSFFFLDSKRVKKVSNRLLIFYGITALLALVLGVASTQTSDYLVLSRYASCKALRFTQVKSVSDFLRTEVRVNTNMLEYSLAVLYGTVSGTMYAGESDTPESADIFDFVSEKLVNRYEEAKVNLFRTLLETIVEVHPETNDWILGQNLFTLLNISEITPVFYPASQPALTRFSTSLSATDDWTLSKIVAVYNGSEVGKSPLWGVVGTFFDLDALPFERICEEAHRQNVDFAVVLEIEENLYHLINTSVEELRASPTQENIEEFVSSGYSTVVDAGKMTLLLVTRTKNTCVLYSRLPLIVVSEIILCVLLFIISVVLIRCSFYTYNAFKCAPKAPPFAFLKIGPKYSQELWSLAPDEMRQLTNKWSQVIEGNTKQFHAYPLPQHQPFATSFLLHSVSEAVLMASQVLEEVSGHSKTNRKGLEYHRIKEKLLELVDQDGEFAVICLIHWCTDATVTVVEEEETVTYQGADIHLGSRLWPAAPAHCVVLSEEAKDRLVIDEEKNCLLAHACGVCAQGFTKSRSLFVFASSMHMVCKTLKKKWKREWWKNTLSCSDELRSPAVKDRKGSLNTHLLGMNDSDSEGGSSLASSLPFGSNKDSSTSSCSSKGRLSSLHNEERYCATGICKGKDIQLSPTIPAHPRHRLSQPQEMLRRMASKKRVRRSNGKRPVQHRFLRQKPIGCVSLPHPALDGEVATTLPFSDNVTAPASLSCSKVDRPCETGETHRPHERASVADSRDPVWDSTRAEEREKGVEREWDDGASCSHMECHSPSLLRARSADVNGRTFRRRRRAKSTILGPPLCASTVARGGCATSGVKTRHSGRDDFPFVPLHSSAPSAVKDGDATRREPRHLEKKQKMKKTNSMDAPCSFHRVNRTESRREVVRHPRSLRQTRGKSVVCHTGDVCVQGKGATEDTMEAKGGRSATFFFSPAFSLRETANGASGIPRVRPSRRTHPCQKDVVGPLSSVSRDAESSGFRSLSTKRCGEEEWRQSLKGTSFPPILPTNTLFSDSSCSLTNDPDEWTMKTKPTKAEKPDRVHLRTTTDKQRGRKAGHVWQELWPFRATPTSFPSTSAPEDLSGGRSSSCVVSSVAPTALSPKEKTDSFSAMENPLPFTQARRPNAVVVVSAVRLPVPSLSLPEKRLHDDVPSSFSESERHERERSGGSGSSEKKSADLTSSSPPTLSESVFGRMAHLTSNEDEDSVETHPLFSGLPSGRYSSSPSLSSFSSSSGVRPFFPSHGEQACKRKHFLSRVVVNGGGGGGVVEVPSRLGVPVGEGSSSSFSFTPVRPLALRFSSSSEYSVGSLPPRLSHSPAEHPPHSGPPSTGVPLCQSLLPLSGSSLLSPTPSSFAQGIRNRSSLCSTKIGPRRARERSGHSLSLSWKKCTQRGYSSGVLRACSSDGHPPSQTDDPCVWVARSRSPWKYSRSTSETTSKPFFQFIGRQHRRRFSHTILEEKGDHEDGRYRMEAFHCIPSAPCTFLFLASSVSSPLHVFSTLSSYTKRSLRHAFDAHRLSSTMSFDQVFPLIAMFYIARELLFQPLSPAENENITRCVATAFGVPVEGVTNYIAVHCTFHYIFQKKEMIETL